MLARFLIRPILDPKFPLMSDPNVYLKLIHVSLMIIVLYVDDLLITGISKKEIASLKDAMNHAFSMTN